MEGRSVSPEIGVGRSHRESTPWSGRIVALARMPRWRFRPYNVIPFSVAFIASGNENDAYLVLGIVAIFLYSWTQDFANISGDRLEDAINRPYRVELARRAGGYCVVFRASVVSFGALILVLAAMVLWAGLDPIWLPVWIAGPLLAYGYSYGPHSKAGTYASPLSHALIPSLPLLLGWTGSGPVEDILPYFAILALVRLSNAGLGFKDIDDLPGDAAIGYRSIHTQIIEGRHTLLVALAILLAPFVAVVAFGLVDEIGNSWPIPLLMLAFAFPFLRLILAARTKAEGISVREAGNFYQLTFITLVVFVLEPEWYTLAIGAGGLVWYTLFTLFWHLDPGELSRGNIAAAIAVIRRGRSAAVAEQGGGSSEPAPGGPEHDPSARYRLQRRIYASKAPESAVAAADAPVAEWDPGAFEGHKYCLVITYRRNGSPVATPVWFAADRDRLVFLSASSSGKVKRLRHNSAVRIAPCTFRGQPLGAPMEAGARFLEEAQGAAAERALRDHYGLLRRLYYRLIGPKEVVHMEVRPRDTETGAT